MLCVTNHAVERFKERTGAKYNRGTVVKNLRTLYEKSVQVTPDPKKIKKQHTENCSFFFNNGFLLVVYDNRRLVTVYNEKLTKFQTT